MLTPSPNPYGALSPELSESSAASDTLPVIKQRFWRSGRLSLQPFAGARVQRAHDLLFVRCGRTVLLHKHLSNRIISCEVGNIEDHMFAGVDHTPESMKKHQPKSGRFRGKSLSTIVSQRSEKRGHGSAFSEGRLNLLPHGTDNTRPQTCTETNAFEHSRKDSFFL